MSETPASLRRKIERAGDLQAVFRTMKAVAASSIGQYEKAVRSLETYSRTVEWGLGVCLRNTGPAEKPVRPPRREKRPVGAVVFGSDQGLVGPFNDRVAAHAVRALGTLSPASRVWAVGERVHERLKDAGLPLAEPFPVPGSVKAVTPLVGRLLVESESLAGPETDFDLLLFYNSPRTGAVYAPVRLRLLPLDEDWRRETAERPWPGPARPEIVGGGGATLRALVREYLFVSLFRACAESLASENASRLAAMQRADKNIDDLLEELQSSFHRQRQNRIDSELFDVIAGFEALGGAG